MTEKKRNRRLPAVFLAAALAVAGTSGCSVAGYEIDFDREGLGSQSVFSINGKSCSEEEARLYLCNYKNLYGTAYGVDLWKYDFKDSLEEYVKAITVDELSRIHCMEQIAHSRGIELDADQEKKVDQVTESYYNSLSKEAVDYMGLTREHLREYYRRYALAVKLYETMTGDSLEEISDDEARVIRLRQICTRDRAKAEEAKKKLDRGKDFSSVAGSYSEAENLDLTVARGQLEKSLEEVAFNLENDQISEVIPAGKRFFILQCVSKYEEKLTEENKQLILDSRRKQKFTDTYGDFVKKVRKTFDEKEWASMPMPEAGIKTDSFFSEYERG